MAVGQQTGEEAPGLTGGPAAGRDSSQGSSARALTWFNPSIFPYLFVLVSILSCCFYQLLHFRNIIF